MKIVQTVFEHITKSIPKTPPEIGGILGGKNGVITDFYIDLGLPIGKMCSYSPNVELLNSVILSWQETGIEFMGLFHIHYRSADSLSDGDINYIKRIMRAMPDSISALYFPIIIMPDKQLVPYVAEREGKDVLISRQNLYII